MTKAKSITLTGFRNFKNVTIDLSTKTLVVGANDIGKSNLLRAIRLLLDKELSEQDLEPLDSDFYAHEPTDKIEILMEFVEADEDCIRSRFRDHISDEATFCLGYRAQRDPATDQKNYSLLAGQSKEKLVEIDARFYLRVLDAKYISSQRSLHSFIRHERRRLLEDAKGQLTGEERMRDTEGLQGIKKTLRSLGEQVRGLNYVQKATVGLNNELSLMSHHHSAQEVVFNASPPDTTQFVSSLDLAGKIHDQTLAISGDGRSNQIHFALWAARHNLADSPKDPLQVTMFLIEEPEAHLHPHQQRRLAEYLSQTLAAQVVITTHSPHIASEFSPSSIVRLYNAKDGASVAGRGCSGAIEEAFIKFGYRMSAVPAEAIFAAAVLLVEGPSDELFYRALASENNMNLDRLNISVLSAQGIGFAPYVGLLKALHVPYVIRTDNDVMKVPRAKPAKYRMAGVIRAIDLLAEHVFAGTQAAQFRKHRENFSGFNSTSPPSGVVEQAKQLLFTFEQNNIFVATTDLENDLWTELSQSIEEFLETDDKIEAISMMKEQKATFMFEFLRAKRQSLAALAGGDLIKPLLRCKEIVDQIGTKGSP